MSDYGTAACGAKQPFGDATLSPLLEGKTEIAERWSRGFGPFAAVGVGKAILKREFCHDPSRSKLQIQVSRGEGVLPLHLATERRATA